MIGRTAKYGARLSLIAENQVVTLSRHLATLKGLWFQSRVNAFSLAQLDVHMRQTPVPPNPKVATLINA